MKKKKISTLAIIVVLIIVIIFFRKYSHFNTIVPKLETSEETISKSIDITSNDQVSIATVGTKELIIDPQTTNVTLYDGDTKLLETLPGLNSNEKSSLVRSPIVVDYKTTSTSATSSMNAYDESINKGTYQIDLVEDGAIVTYSLGQAVTIDDQVPQAIEKKRYEAIEKKISDAQKVTLSSYYSYSKEKDAYIRPPKIKPSKMSEIYSILYDDGDYTTEDLEKDNKILNSSSSAIVEPISFVIPVKYALDPDGNFKVSIDLDKVTYSGVHQFTQIRVLPGLLAAKDGYFLVPDGSGAIIDLKTSKTVNRYNKEYSPVLEDVLGEYKNIVSEDLSLPVFANSNILGIITNGSAASSLNVDLSSSSKLIYPTINMQYGMFYELNTTGNGVNLASKETNGQFEVTYYANEKEQSYYDYAQVVSEYYANKYSLERIDNQFTTNLEVIGAYNFTNYLLGIPYDDINSLTTLEQVNTMLEQLDSQTNYNISYYGWAKAGLNANGLDTKLNKSVKKGLENDEVISNLSYAVNLVTLDQDYLGQFNKNTDVVYGIQGKANKMYPILNSSFEEDKLKTTKYLISPSKLTSVIEQFSKQFDLSSNITITDLGMSAYGDYLQNKEVTPILAETIIMNNLNSLNEQFNVTINSPILERGFTSDNIIGLSSESSNHDIFDYDVPFTQLVYYRLIPTANEPINLSNDGNITNNVLKAMETKSNLDFVVSFEDSSSLKTTDFDKYYAISFDYWSTVINDAINEYNQFIAKIENGTITNHQIVAENIVKITYDNGLVAYFNYNDIEVEIDGIKLKPNNYVVKKGA